MDIKDTLIYSPHVNKTNRGMYAVPQGRTRGTIASGREELVLEYSQDMMFFVFVFVSHQQVYRFMQVVFLSLIARITVSIFASIVCRNPFCTKIRKINTFLKKRFGS